MLNIVLMYHVSNVDTCIVIVIVILVEFYHTIQKLGTFNLVAVLIYNLMSLYAFSAAALLS